MDLEDEYVKWISLRKNSVDERGEKLCYCGHTYKCECADPDISMFEQSVGRGDMKLGDSENGWRKRK